MLPGTLVRHTCAARLTSSLVRLKLDGFRQHLGAALVGADQTGFVLQLPLPGSIWQRCLGRQPALEIHLRLNPPQAAGLTEIEVEVRTVRCQADLGALVLERESPPLLHSLRSYLQVDPERRRYLRIPFPYGLGVLAVLPDQQLSDPVVAQGKNISRTGLALYLSEEPISTRVYIQPLLAPELTRLALLAKVVRVERCADGRYEVGMILAEQAESWLPPQEMLRGNSDVRTPTGQSSWPSTPRG
jgi:hypothetical protein